MPRIVSFLVFCFLATSSLANESVRFASETLAAMGHPAADAVRNYSGSSQTLPGASDLTLFTVGNWEVAASERTGMVAIKDLTVERPQRLLDRRPDGMSREAIINDVRDRLAKLGWKEGVDYVIGEVSDAEHPHYGKTSESQQGLQVTRLELVKIENWPDPVSIGHFAHDIASGEIVAIDLSTRPWIKVEDLAKVIPPHVAALKAREAVIRYLQKVNPAAIDQIPSVNEIETTAGQSLTIPWNMTKSEIPVEAFPEALRLNRQRAALYSFKVGPARVWIHATSGRVVRASLLSDEAVRPDLRGSDSGGRESVALSPETSAPVPRQESPTAPPIPLLVGGGVAILGAGAAFVLTRKRS
jgi:hypothetical protein